MIDSPSGVSMVSLWDTSASVAHGGVMKRFFTFALAFILFTQTVFAETEIDPTDISFESNRKFISSLAFGAAFIDDRDPSLELKYSIRW